MQDAFVYAAIMYERAWGKRNYSALRTLQKFHHRHHRHLHVVM